ncbi:hypothetical protein [Microtetraspora niveoalba]|uniref:hypothetical protein n=1 Tax=Microtetraspora niveoalba TaxID=46175 RepID=UPI000A4E8F25|nr:hypothetical protein [Microtetraspora niveoalba]
MASISDVPASEEDITGSGLGPAVESLLAGWAERVAVPVEVWASPTRDVPDDAARLAYRILVDALHRVEGAQEISVAMTTGRTLRLTVSCGGLAAERGADADAVAAANHLRARVKAMRGIYSTGSAAGDDMTITLELPLP